MIDRFGYLGSAADGAAALMTGEGVAAAQLVLQLKLKSHIN